MSSKRTFAPGDRVRYARPWLRFTYQQAGDVVKAKGTVTATIDRAHYQVCIVEWDGGDMPPRALSSNLELCDH